MRMRLWAGSVLAGSAIATGACMYCATSAYADSGVDGGGGGTTSSSGVQRDDTPARDTPTAGRSLGPAARTAGSALVERPGRAAVDAASDDGEAGDRPSREPSATAARRAEGVSTGVSVLAPVRAADRSHAASTVLAPARHAATDDAAADDADVAAAAMPVDPVGLALTQLAEAQTLLLRETWGRGDVFAGIASVAPQFLIAQAQWSLNQWRTTNSQHKSLFADTEGVPVAHELAGLGLSLNNSLPFLAQESLEQAAALLPGLGQLGAGDGLSEVIDLLGDARRNGMVYSVIPVEMRTNSTSLSTEPIIFHSVNGCGMVPVLVDTGSFGLMMDPRYVGPEGLGEPIGSDTSGYGDTFQYGFDIYVTTVDFGDGVVSAPTPVGIVQTESIDGFADYDKFAGYAGILGIGPDAGGPLKTSPVNALPGMLGRGVFLDEESELLVLGANPLPERTWVRGTRPELTVRVGGLPAAQAPSVIDSGGIRGGFPGGLLAVDGIEGVPAGTVISVYDADGDELLYTYTTTEANTFVLTDGDEGDFNTGFTPFALGPVYIDFTSLQGRTVFDYPRIGYGGVDPDDDGDDDDDDDDDDDYVAPGITRW